MKSTQTQTAVLNNNPMPPLIEDEDDVPLTRVQDDYATRAVNKSGISSLLNRIKSIFDIFEPASNQQNTESLNAVPANESEEASEIACDSGANITAAATDIDESAASIDEQIEPQSTEISAAPSANVVFYSLTLKSNFMQIEPTEPLATEDGDDASAKKT